MSYIHPSEAESERFGLKVGRTGRLGPFDAEAFVSEIIEGAYDVIKLKVPLHDAAICQTLDDLPFFKAPLNYVTLQHRPLIQGDLPTDPSLTFELYTGQHPEELLRIVKEISSQDTNLYYASHLHDLLMPPELFWTGAHAFYLSMDHSKDPDKYLFIGRDADGQAAGICSFQRSKGSHAEGVIYGVRPAFRGKGLAASFLNHSVNTLFNAGYTDFYTEVQYFNFRSLYPHIHMGFKPAGMYINIILFPLLRRTLKTLPLENSDVISWSKSLIKDHLSTLGLSDIQPEMVETKGAFHRETGPEKEVLQLVAAGNNCAVIRMDKADGSAYARFKY